MLFILLPAFNEEQALPGLLRNIVKACAGLPYRIVLINDGSTDRTMEIARDFAESSGILHLVEHEQNRGLGQALLSGFRYIIKHKSDEENRVPPAGNWPDAVLTMDADNTHSPSLIPLLYARIREGEDLVIASRYAPGGRQLGLSAWRRFLSWGAGKVMHLFFPIQGLRDYSCGYRVYRLSILKEGIEYYGEKLMESRSFAAMVELLLKLVPFCHNLGEVPLVLHYERKQGVSKMKVWSTVIGYITLIINLKRMAWSRMKWADEWAEE